MGTSGGEGRLIINYLCQKMNAFASKIKLNQRKQPRLTQTVFVLEADTKNNILDAPVI